MSRNGSGTYSLPAGNPVVAGTTITSSWANTTLSDIASTLTLSIASDGQTPMSGNLNMASNKIIALATPTATTDAVTKAYADALIAGGSAGVFTSVTDSGLTSGRVTYATTAGLLTDSANMTFDGSTLTTLNTAYTGTLTGGTGVVNLGSGQFYKDASGNVGIGTASPTNKLDVNGAIRLNAGSDQGSQLNIWTTAGGDGTLAAYNIAFNTGANSARTERMRIDTSGNVGIGTSSPGAKLMVYGASGTSISLNNSTTTTATSTGFQIQTGSTTDAYIWNYSNGYIAIATNNTERMRIDSSGNVLIGVTSSSTTKLRTQGASATSADYSLYCTNSSPILTLGVRNDGAVFTGTSGSGLAACPYNNTTASAANLVVGTGGDLQRSTSSLKYKTDVQDAMHGLAEVLKLRPVTYKGINDGDIVFGGLIAEEVDATGLTEFVQYAEDGSPDALAYGQMVSLAFKAIQEQQVMIKDLQAKVAALEATK